MEFRILGPLEVIVEGRPVPLPRHRSRALLALLLLRANELVSTDRLVDELWGGEPPRTATAALHNAVSRLRRVLEPEMLVSRARGYELRVAPELLDLVRFERLVDEAKGAEPEERAAKLHEALTLWRGEPLADLADEPFAQPEIRRLEELRLAVLEERIDADLALGRDRELVAELERLVEEYPFKERLRGQLMLALYRAGRQADALAAYRDARSTLVDEIGIEPSADLQQLQRSILEQDPSLAPWRPPSAPAAPAFAATSPRERSDQRSRKTVTVLFCDIVGWTAIAERLDAEPLHALLSRYQELAKDVLERHGGTVEKFIGDAVMAVFGVPRLHEDDALRAVRAAVDLRPALAALNEELKREWGVRIDVKVAVNTGEVVAGEDLLGNPRVAGDTVNVAGRLEQEVAAAGDIVLGDETYRLVKHAVLAEPLRAAPVRGRRGSVRPWRLLAYQEVSALARVPAAEFVGRGRELARLEQALGRAKAERVCVLCTVVGPPGIGKSRIAREFVERASGTVRVGAGRCLSYGETITYWPLREVVTALAGEDPRGWIRERLGNDATAVAVAERVASAVGVGEAGAGRDETFWAFRKLFETLANNEPLVIAIDDIHWAERTLIEMLEQIADLSVGAPILILCLARPELYETYPEWAIPHPNRRLIELPPLSKRESQGLVGGLERAHELPEHALARAVETAEGNPLFLEQLVAFELEGPADELPPGIDALLAARIERLDVYELALLTCAAIEGRTFQRSSIEMLLPPDDRAKLDEPLRALVRRDFIEPYPSDRGIGETFRFRHVLLRDAAYDALAKASRAGLHERYADALEDRRGEDEVIGFHLEQACRYHAEVSPADRRRTDLALRGADRLGAAGRAALNRGDLVGAFNLLSRATELAPHDSSVRLQLLPDLADALSSIGAPAQAGTVVAEAIDLAGAAGDARTQQRAQLQELWLRLQADPNTDVANILADARAAVTVLEREGDDRALAHAWHLITWVQTNYGKLSALKDAAEHAVAHARTVGDTMTEEEVMVLALPTGPMGPLPLAEVVSSAEAALGRARETGSRRVEMASLVTLAMCAAFQKDFHRARTLIAEAKTIDEDLGGGRGTGFQYWPVGLVELLAGDAQQAERLLRDGYETLRARGDNWWMCGVAAELADALWLQGRDEEALAIAEVSRETTPRDDPVGEMMWRGALAKVLARRGEGREAELLAREALAIIEETDYVVYHADALTDLAEVLRLVNRTDDAAAAAERAAAIYRRKGNVAAAEAVGRLLSKLGGSAVALPR